MTNRFPDLYTQSEIDAQERRPRLLAIILAVVFLVIFAAGAFADDIYSARVQAKNGIAGAAALASIDYTGQGVQVGVGVANYGGDQGYAVKLMMPITDRLNGSVAVFGGEAGDAGFSAALNWKF